MRGGFEVPRLVERHVEKVVTEDRGRALKVAFRVPGPWARDKLAHCLPHVGALPGESIALPSVGEVQAMI